MEQIADRTSFVDVEYLGNPFYIACAVLEGDEGLALIDPGPAVSLPGLDRGLARVGYSIDDVTHLLLTHIHLDHAGGSGTLVQRNPSIRVCVHERGAKHMIDPERLLASAERIYGDQMDALWGEFLAVPEENVNVLTGGEELQAGGRVLDVAYTPGHASHHVSYFDDGTGIAYVGDTAGIRIANEPVTLPVTPPPDIDLEAWDESLQKIEAWSPERLFVTHFGADTNVSGTLDQLRERLMQWSLYVRRTMQSDITDEECATEFVTWVREDLERNLPADKVPVYQVSSMPEMSWHGLARYWRKKEEKKA
jgi:glyoxylase-like metal-dependent hydrolase (beta-lactamase superfamily II)